jgi:hypothetical protein
MSDREYLLIRGRLNRADDFTPRRCGSTTFVRQWPHDEGSDVFVETVSRDGDVLRSHPALVKSELVCAPGSESWRLRAYVPLDADAARVRLRRAGRVFWEDRIPDAPTLRVLLKARPVRGSEGATPATRRRQSGRDDGHTPGFPGGRPAVLTLETSDPAEGGGAFMTIVHRWSERGFRTVYIGPVTRTLEIPADRLPGGRECRLIVIYSNGMRSTTAATKPFGLDPIHPVLQITHPADGSRLPSGSPVTLEGLVQDPEHPSAPHDANRLIWRVDDREVGAGPLTSVDPLESGEHTITLSYRVVDDTPRRTTASRALPSASVRVVVAQAKAVPANAWPTWNPFGDA